MVSEETIIEELKRIVRVKSKDADTELQGLLESCKKELEIAGVYGDETDPLYRQAIRLYAKANYGYDKDVERFQNSFDSLRDSMALSGDYDKDDVNDSNIDTG